METRIAQTASGPIEYRSTGSGPALLVLLGGHCSRNSRLSHERLAQAGFTVITPSRPGYDATPASVGPTAQAAADALAALLDTLAIPHVDLIGISAAGPTALAFAQRHSQRTRKLVLESAITSPWDARTSRAGRLVFGRAERVTWGLIKSLLRIAPDMICKALLSEMTTLPIHDVWRRMRTADQMFVRRMIESSQSGTGFLHDLDHRVDEIASIQTPTLVMYSPNDKTVRLHHAQRAAQEIAGCELYETPADSHLIWIGAYAEQVWQKRLAFLRQ